MRIQLNEIRSKKDIDLIDETLLKVGVSSFLVDTGISDGARTSI